ncbi:hypothetical protein IC607_07140 [Cellulomonas sp. JH27-2]|uniref:hypothetical protein n=1 Tax=Cellulomonas sp. JH27-2 TaxID=2774139 RepID=UPI0017869FE4|nr:hypothetical protein [Cellulomonas sp. JH27-2]MBD8058738.1 hypothetical protein [Cellulomonas sp. JH27-2]
MTRPSAPRGVRLAVAYGATALIVASLGLAVLTIFSVAGGFAPIVIIALGVAFWILPRWLPPLLDPLEPAAWVRYLGDLWRWARDEPTHAPPVRDPVAEQRHAGLSGASRPPTRW